MGFSVNPDKSRTLFIVKTDNSAGSVYSDAFSGIYDLFETKISDRCTDILKKLSSEISLVFIDAADYSEQCTELVRQIHSDSVLKAIPIVVIADDSEADMEEDFLNAGASYFMCYSVKLSLILLRIASLISLRESAESGGISEIDEITGLYNRQAFFSRADKIIKENPNWSFILTISELDGIKLLNEKNGKTAGDDLLKSVGDFLRNAPEQCLLAGRFAGDQFVTLFRKDEKFSPEFLEASIQNSNQIIAQDCGVENLRVRFAVYEDIDHDISVMELCDRTLLALQKIRGKYGKTITKYDSSILFEHRKRERIEDSMKEALEKNQFRVYYQPKHDVNTGELTGAEALIRWEHPEYGFMSPGDFIPVFESNGFITEVDNFVWSRTCENLRKWIDKGLDVVPISINASKLDFLKPDFFKKLHEASERMRINPGLLHIEVTESLFSDQIEELVQILARCQKNGYKIELDDFGSGYSSLNTLSILPLDIVKMDMSLVKAITNFKSMRVFSACITLAKSLGLKTVSEGVETNEQMWTIRELGGDSIQGYIYSKPLPEDEFEKYLLEKSRKKKLNSEETE